MRTTTIGWKRVVAVATITLFIGSVGTPARADAPSCTATGAEALTTGATEYVPGDLVEISGTGFGASCNVSIRVSWGSGADNEDDVATDDAGALHDFYLIGDNGGIHTVEAIGVDGSVLASTSFNVDPIFLYATEADRAADVNRRVAFERGDTVYARASGLTAAVTYRLRVINPSNGDEQLTPCFTGVTSRDDFFVTDSSDQLSFGTRWHYQILGFGSGANAATDCASVTSVSIPDQRPFRVVQAVAFASAADANTCLDVVGDPANVVTPCTNVVSSFAPGSTIYLRVLGFHDAGNVSTTWKKPLGAAACANTTLDDRVPSNNGRLPSRTADLDYLLYVPGGSSEDNWNDQANYNAGACPATTDAGVWTLTVNTADAAEIVELDAFTINGAPDPDADDDGINDVADNCVSTPNPDQTDTDFDTIGDACDPDDDNDGVLDGPDNCDLIANTGQANNDGDLLGDVCDEDDDDDLVLDGDDNCPLVDNFDQTDTDGDNVGDACDEDTDGDGVDDVLDNCDLVDNPDQTDTDGDNVGDACDEDDDDDGVDDVDDNCDLVDNPDQTDTDGGGLGDACDDDDDNDFVDDDDDNCVLVPNTDQLDTNDDGEGDACDTDDDGDGDADGADNCPLTPNANQLDTDADGVGDACDTVLTYSGDTQRLGAGYVTMKATLADATAACNVHGKSINFYVDLNNDGDFVDAGELVQTKLTVGTDNSAQATADPYNLALGIWFVRVEFLGTAGCPAASDEVMIAVVSPDDAANGGGWYQISGVTGASKSVNFGFTTRWDTKAGAYRGQILVHNKQAWRLKGEITGFTKKTTTNPVSGEVGGTAQLFCWNATTATWKLADSTVTFKAVFNDTGVPNKKTGTVKPDSFTVNSIGAYAPQNACPASITPLVQSALQALKGGNVHIK